MIRKGTSAYVCSCGIALHEGCAGKVLICPDCKSKVNVERTERQ